MPDVLFFLSFFRSKAADERSLSSFCWWDSDSGAVLRPRCCRVCRGDKPSGACRAWQPAALPFWRGQWTPKVSEPCRMRAAAEAVPLMGALRVRLWAAARRLSPTGAAVPERHCTDTS